MTTKPEQKESPTLSFSEQLQKIEAIGATSPDGSPIATQLALKEAVKHLVSVFTPRNSRS